MSQQGMVKQMGRGKDTRRNYRRTKRGRAVLRHRVRRKLQQRRKQHVLLHSPRVPSSANAIDPATNITDTVALSDADRANILQSKPIRGGHLHNVHNDLFHEERAHTVHIPHAKEGRHPTNRNNR